MKLHCLAVLAAFAVPLAHAQSSMEAAPLVAPFSSFKPGSVPPSPWSEVRITDRKKPTLYSFVTDGGATVLRALADGAATGLAHPVNFDVRAAPFLAWRWKIDRLIATADNTVPAKEDSPVRIVLEFEGDKGKLSLSERSFFALSEKLSGREIPYATMMYIWSNTAPVGTIVPNPRTGRVQMIVASSGEAGVGAWQSIVRNVYDDYKRAFKEEPGKLVAVGVLTDTDNTGERVEAWYGDLQFRSSR